jgi:hypothetical protein
MAVGLRFTQPASRVTTCCLSTDTAARPWYDGVRLIIGAIEYGGECANKHGPAIHHRICDLSVSPPDTSS